MEVKKSLLSVNVPKETINAAALIIDGIHNLSRMDAECQWKKQKAPDKVKSVEELYPCPKEYNCLSRKISNKDRSWFYQELKKVRQLYRHFVASFFQT